MQQLVEDYTYRPHIHTICVGMELCLLRCDVFFGASNSLHDYILGA